MKNISTKVQDEAAQEITKIYKSRYDGAQTAIEGFLAIRINTLSEIKKKNFTHAEIMSIVASLNGTMTSGPRMQCNQSAFMAHMQDYEELENGISQYEADPETLYKKLSNLTAAQIYFLQDEIYLWWKRSEEQSLESFIETMTL